MKRITLLVIAVIAIIAFFCSLGRKPEVDLPVAPAPIQTLFIQTSAENCYVGRIESSDINVRVLCLKHTFEKMASGDTKLVIEAANLAKTKGLNIADIGDFFIDSKGEAQAKKVIYDVRFYENELKDFISKQMKTNAEADDTLIVFTVGHGSKQGDLQTLGKRSDILKVIGTAAEENNQRTIWWQLSCYAAAQLPSINSLPEKQQKTLAVVASSDTRTPSPAGVEGKIMEKVLVAMATNDPTLDLDKNDTITAGELKQFLNKIQAGRGELVFAKSPEHVLFAGLNMARRIPITDENSPDQTFPKDYLPLPR